MFIWIADEDGEAAVGRVPTEWSSGKQKFIVSTLMYSTNVLKYVCVLSSLFGLRDFVHRSWSSGGSWEFVHQEGSAEDRSPVSSLC